MIHNYYYSQDGQSRHGPVRPDELQKIGLTRETLIWREGLPDWVRAGDLAELAGLFSTSGPFYQPSYGHPTPASAGQYDVVPPNYMKRTNAFAVTSLVLGILGLVTSCFVVGLLLAILAVGFGHLAQRQIFQTGQPGYGLAMVGLVTGYIATGISLLILFVFFLFPVLIELRNISRGGS